VTPQQSRPRSGKSPAAATVVDIDVDIVQKIVIVDPVSAPFALKTLELIINNRLHVKKIM